MAGIYIHIPFCRQACFYCDFHFSTNLKNQEAMVEAIVHELSYRSNYLTDEVSTIYFGGGTPSVLTKNQIAKFIQTIKKKFKLTSDPEITLEANPEDLTPNKLDELRKLGINRLSIGVQTFHDKELKWMNRIHDSKQAISSIKNARKAGFSNISLDLIYALPGNGHSLWKDELTKAVELDTEHISLYGLTIEDRTVFGNRKKNNQLIEMPEEAAADQYLHAISFLNSMGMDHYEVSNFAKPGYYSQHNLAYWSGRSYLGVGPGAHSFDGLSRQLNIRNNSKYLKAIQNGESYFEIENLSKIQRMNEFILTGLRKKEGISFEEIRGTFGIDFLDIYSDILNQYDHQGLIELNENSMHLTSYGFLVADEMALRLFFQE